MFQFLKRRKSRPRTTSADRQRTRLGCEPLEVRDLMAQYYWAPTDPGNKWSLAANWLRSDPGGSPERTNVLPGENDNIAFVAVALQSSPPISGDFDCVIDVNARVHSLIQTAGYTKAVKVQGSLTITGTDTASSLIMNATPVASLEGMVAPVGGQIFPGTVNLPGKATFGWMQGTLRHLTVYVLRQSDTIYATLNVAGDNSVNRMENVTLSVGGVLSWSGKSVQVDNGGPLQLHSRISIVPGGQFNITGDTAQWGLVNSPDDLKVENYGTVTHNSANWHRIDGDYENRGVTEIQQGKLVLAGKAEQYACPTPGWASEVRLFPGTQVELIAPDQTLKIYDGSLVGYGTVIGHVHLGTAGSPSVGAPSISPGLAAVGAEPSRVTPAIGTLTITKNL